MFRDSPSGPDPRRSEASVVGEEDPTVDVKFCLCGTLGAVQCDVKKSIQPNLGSECVAMSALL